MGCFSHWETLFTDNLNTFQDFGSSVLSLLWILFQVDCLSLLHLVIFAGFYFAPSIATYSSIISFCLTVFVCGLLSAGCLTVVPLASGVCPLVDEVVPVAPADFLVRRTVPDIWWMELGLVPPVAMTLSGSCEFSMTLVSLSVDECACIPVVLVVCSKVF